MKNSFLSKTAAVGITALAVVAFTGTAHANLYLTPGTPVAVGLNLVVATDGHVFAKYLGSGASLSDDLYLDSPGSYPGIIFNNHSTSVGTVVDLGLFSAGTELIFREYVNGQDNSFYTGQASRNPDGFVHAFVLENYDGFGATYVGFEDLFGNDSDFNYEDITYEFSNVVSVPSTPDASATLPLLGFGFAGLMMLRRRAGK